MCQNRCLTSRIPSCPPAHHDAHKVAQLYHWDKIFIASWYSDVVDSQVKRFLVPNDPNLTSAPDSWTEVKDACRGRNTTRNSHIDTEGCCTIGCRTEGCYLSPRWRGQLSFSLCVTRSSLLLNDRQFPNPGVLRGGNLAISFAQASGFSFTLSYSQADGGISIGFFCFFSPVVNFPKVDGERLGCLKFKFPRPRNLDFGSPRAH